MITPKVGDIAPSGSARQKCWKARDAYFSCLDGHGIWLLGVNPKTHQEIIDVQPNNPVIKAYSEMDAQEKSAYKTCVKLKEFYNRECLKSWVSHFETLRLQDKQAKYLMDKLEKDSNRGSDFWDRVSSKE